jgi:hypothetical protein
MAGHFMVLPARLMKASPEPPILHVHVLDPPCDCRADPRERKHPHPDQRPVPHPKGRGDIDAVEPLRPSVADRYCNGGTLNLSINDIE